ncbi:hypothetical protein DMA15_27465 [Streptomyces sp. WAC 01529]|uniref:hypothetical protein n=1 Tax=Streptomyces sp. WAC 01529 TaxID=2203205 RepID=UPI000F6C61A3|nr:hypothetical protein [Streptomyces sp. WAC 01529]AZM55869.1 hypothetical protein DMA15_27465 [Streptomyces sp. WAC 01529]
MPSYPTAPRSRPGPRRRSLFAGAAGIASAALLTGCSDAADSGAEHPSAVRRVRARAAKDSTELLGRYDAVLAAHPSLAGRLGPLRAEVEKHVEAFGGGGAPASPSPSGSASGAAAPAPEPSVASDPDKAVRDLADAERALADRRGAALVDAPAEQARLLASVAAAGAAHAYLLTEGDKK